MAIAIPKATYAKTAPWSGLAIKQFIYVSVGVVNTHYCGEVAFVLFNHANNDFRVYQGDRFAQLILERIETPAIEVVNELNDTSREAAGFGSSRIQPIPRIIFFF